MAKVQCPSCKKVCYQTTASFDADTMPNGGMVTLLKPWSSYGWGKFGGGGNSGSSVMASDMLCVVCEAALAPAGRLTVVPDDHQEVPKPPTLEQKNQERIRAIELLEPIFNAPAITMDDIATEEEDGREVFSIDVPDEAMGHPDDYNNLTNSLPQERIDAECIDKAGEPNAEPISSLTQDNQFPFVTVPFPTVEVDGFVCDQCGWTGKTDAALKRHKTIKRHN